MPEGGGKVKAGGGVCTGRRSPSDASEKFSKDVCTALSASIANVDDQDLIRSDSVEKRKGRATNMVLSDTFEILETCANVRMGNDGPFRRLQSRRHGSDVELWMALVVCAHPSKAGFGSRQVTETHALQRAAGKSS